MSSAVTATGDIPDYCNLPQPRQQSSIASAAAAVAASTSFNSKRSRHSSLWSLQDEDDQRAVGDADNSDMTAGTTVNYVNSGGDPFGGQPHFSTGNGGTSGNCTTSTSEFGAMLQHHDTDRNINHQTRISVGGSTSAFQQNSRYSASNEALN